MKRTSLNFWVDALAFAEFAFLATTGVLMRYLLPPGSGRFTTMLGLDRHEWGSVHFWVALAMFATLAVHLALHWKWIVCVVKGRSSEASGQRLLLGGVGLVGVVALAASPLFAPVETTRGSASPDAAPHVEPAGALAHDSSINGRTTVAELERIAGVTPDDLRRRLGIDARLRPDDRLGPLRREFGFELEEVRRLAAEKRAGPSPP